MMSRKHWKETAIPGVRALAVLAMLVTTLFGAAMPTAAQGSVDVAIYTVENGHSAYDACYVLVGYSQVGCDENDDGKVTFADIPYGSYTVQQTANLGSGRYVNDFTITVTGSVNAEGYEGFTATIVGGSGSSAGSAPAGYSNVAIEPTENGRTIYDACFVIVDYSEVGCDENRDGKVTFEDIPYGEWMVHQVADLGPNRSMPHLRIYVTGQASPDGWERFPAYIANTGGASGSSGYSDIAIVPTQNGQPVYDACFVIVDYSEVGCDENRDGKITFEDIPYGTWTVRQVADLGPGRFVADFTIHVTGAASGDGWERFPATVGGTGGGSAAGAKDISLITREPQAGGLLTGTCYILLDYSNEGCDENGDGQVTFDDMPPGTYTVRQTRTPAGYATINDFPITVDDALQNVPVGYIVKQAPEQNAPGTRNTSFVFIDANTKLVPTPICLQVGNVSNVGCDDHLVDGQIDFLDVQLGTHELAFSNLPSDWQILGGMGPYTVNIVAGTGPQIIYVHVLTGSESGSASVNVPSGSGAIAVVGSGQNAATSPGAPSSGPASAGPAVELILDTSNSMNERDQGGQTRLEVAKTVTTRLVTETLPAGVPMALRTYSGCSSSLAIPMGPLDPNAATGTIANLRASGQTPIAQSLRAAGNDLDGVSGPKIIVLVTDGEETCGGDPRSEIEALVAQNVDIQVNIVGFAIDDATLTATFQDWARVGNGTYFAASDEIELDQAVTTASQLSFRVLDGQGMAVATGTVGGGPVAVPAGTYAVEIDTNPVTRHENVVVTAGQTTTIDLGAAGTTGSGGGTSSVSSSAGSTVPGSSGASGTSLSAQDSGDMKEMQITAIACDSADLAAITAGINGDGSCYWDIGATFTVTTGDGAYLGSCTLTGDRNAEIRIAGNVNCTVSIPDGVRVVVTEEVNTITPGTFPIENPMDFTWPDPQFVASYNGVSFTNVPQSGTAGTSSSGEATLLLTFWGCPEGFDPATGDFFSECTEPLDAPGNAFVDFHGEGQGGEFIAMLDRQSNVGYVYTANPGTMNVELRYLDPVAHDTYQVFGADGASGDAYAVYLADGETREVFIFYYFS